MGYIERLTGIFASIEGFLHQLVGSPFPLPPIQTKLTYIQETETPTKPCFPTLIRDEPIHLFKPQDRSASSLERGLQAIQGCEKPFERRD